MGLIILVLFIAVPICEIAVFIEAGQRFGLWPTIGAIIATAVIGTTCMRIQGLSVLRRVQESMARNEMPLQEVFDGLCLLVAGALLLTPGFITDSVGFCLLFPPFRRAFGASIAARVMKRGRAHNGNTAHGAQNSPHSGQGGGPIIDGEFVDKSEDQRAGAPDDGANLIADRRDSP